ncbi:hypothetical protein CMI41_04920 [Candidatus Pacearchaeota archaeon]|nr:hypothetical protein [Candidatus Pacearchaeota archaeon]|tara:strand:+ start:3870 stop:4085 length:216 start_codon:yes stop_codon:yes gene_type:complete
MKTITVVAELTYNEKLMHGDGKNEKKWFENAILMDNKGLLLHDNEVTGDTIGTVNITQILEPWNELDQEGE